MRHNDGSNQPALLMLSHCVPDACGDARRARAWQMLRLAAHTHRVHLVALEDGPVNLVHWRALQNLCQRVVIQARGISHRWLARGIALLDPAAAARVNLAILADPLATWLEDTRFDAIIMTHPALWPIARHIQAPRRIADLHWPASRMHPRHNGAEGRTDRSWNAWQARMHAAQEHAAAQGCDAVTIADPEHAASMSPTVCRAILLPDAVDLDYFAQAPRPRRPDPADAPSCLFVHVDRSTGDLARQLDWFRREIWPTVVQAVPEATLSWTGRETHRTVNAELLRAAVVVSPADQPELAHWPVLQALAMRRPLVAASPGVEGLGILHGKHALLSRNQREWVDYCVQSLRSARFRLQLADGGRDHVERHFPVVSSGIELLRAMQPGRPGPALAA